MKDLPLPKCLKHLNLRNEAEFETSVVMLEFVQLLQNICTCQDLHATKTWIQYFSLRDILTEGSLFISKVTQGVKTGT